MDNCTLDEIYDYMNVRGGCAHFVLRSLEVTLSSLFGSTTAGGREARGISSFAYWPKGRGIIIVRIHKKRANIIAILVPDRHPLAGLEIQVLGERSWRPLRTWLDSQGGEFINHNLNNVCDCIHMKLSRLMHHSLNSSVW